MHVEEIEDRIIYAVYQGLSRGQKRDDSNYLQSESYWNQEPRNSELNNEYEREGREGELNMDLDFVISEIQI